MLFSVKLRLALTLKTWSTLDTVVKEQEKVKSHVAGDYSTVENLTGITVLMTDQSRSSPLNRFQRTNSRYVSRV